MSVSNPLLKELKGCTRKLMEWGKDIHDDNIDLEPFCICLEKCLQNGVLKTLNIVGFPKTPGVWYWLEELAEKYHSLNYTFASVIEQTKQNERTKTSIGRLRYFIRICLTRKCLHIPVELLVRTSHLATEFYSTDSLLGNDILGEILLSVLLQCSRLNFKLNLKNSSFLDETWQLPECLALELVPCKKLGISVCFIKGKALIINLDQSSVAAEDDKIKIGDILDEINDIPITANTEGKLHKIMRKGAGQPILLHIIKLRYKETNELYGPISNLIKDSSKQYIRNILNNPKPQISQSSITGTVKTPSVNRAFNAGFAVKYCGTIHVGTQGDVKHIEKAIWNLLQSGQSKLIPAKFECLEIGIRVTQDSDDAIICNQSYMEISSCGRTSNIPDYFAFIAGDANCNVATKFDAFVFYHRNEDEVQTILQSLGQGFQRTHFAV